MRRYFRPSPARLAAVTLGLGLAACTSTPAPNPALDQARARVSSASEDPNVAKQVPLELERARQALQQAEASWNSNAEPKVVSHQAYLASQQAAIAEETARLRTTQEQIKMAEADRAKTLLSAREQELAGLKARQTERGTIVSLPNVLFRLDSAELLPGSAASINRLASFLQRHPDSKVSVEGHTDSPGSENYNLDLSQRRADAVRQALVSRGIDPGRVVAQGFGETAPIASNDSPQGRQINRRVDVVVSGQGLQTPQAAGSPR